MGIDTKNYVPTETDKKFQREHEYSKDHAKLESGKLRHTYYFKKKKKPNQQEKFPLIHAPDSMVIKV